MSPTDAPPGHETGETIAFPRGFRWGTAPVLVTEDGISTDDDALRVRYLGDALAGLAGCIDDGVDTRGYFCWSAMDNFEWIRGYEPTFGLIAVDRTTFERTVKPSAGWLGEVARANAVDRSGAGVRTEEVNR